MLLLLCRAQRRIPCVGYLGHDDATQCYTLVLTVSGVSEVSPPRSDKQMNFQRIGRPCSTYPDTTGLFHSLFVRLKPSAQPTFHWSHTAHVGNVPLSVRRKLHGSSPAHDPPEPTALDDRDDHKLRRPRPSLLALTWSSGDATTSRTGHHGIPYMIPCWKEQMEVLVSLNVRPLTGRCN